MHVKVDGAELWVEEDGRGVPVLVPTGGGIALYRKTFSKGLLEHLRLMYVEMRGTGGSSGTVEGATFASLADDLEAVRQTLGIERPVVMGLANHGCIALEYALCHGENARCVVLVASGPDFTRVSSLGQERFEAEASPAQRAALERGRAAFATIPPGSLSNDELVVRRYLALAPLRWRDPDFDAAPLWDPEAPRGIAAYLSRVQEHGGTWNAVPRLGETKCPVLAISGRWDYLCPVELWEESIHFLPEGELVVLENSAHNPQLEEQAAFDAALLGFIERH